MHPPRRAAREVVGALLDHLSPALDRSGDLGTVAGLLRDVLERGNGAQRQRADFTRTHDVTAVVTSAVEQTIAF
ncbi:hypothetical protein [Actinomadura madurae]|uniref:hypothetical protein n=1 Tax=Actinomadura madurae TaxID=1993 RepID=UPI0020D1F56A|nr:hypothetical protein [Actinomadura madurae]MCP9954447.1 hypothetical protein [Actinomadura madurae]MCP9983675.1 hypothetical protein [Actinomadura madurae]MCQ0004758.1 hypothetical protein [Actinomadura madurae]